MQIHFISHSKFKHIRLILSNSLVIGNTWRYNQVLVCIIVDLVPKTRLSGSTILIHVWKICIRFMSVMTSQITNNLAVYSTTFSGLQQSKSKFHITDPLWWESTGNQWLPHKMFPCHDNIVCIRSRRCGCLVTWFCYQLIAKPGNKTASPSRPDPSIST